MVFNGSESPPSCLHWSSLVFLVHFRFFSSLFQASRYSFLCFSLLLFSCLLLSSLVFSWLLLSSRVFSCLLLSSLLFCTLFLSILLFSASLYPSCSLPFLLLCFFYSALIIFSFTLLLYCGHRPVALSLNMFKPMRAAWQPTPKVLRSVSLDSFLTPLFSWRSFSWQFFLLLCISLSLSLSVS